MSCILTGSVALDCKDSNGGIAEIKIKVFDSALTGWSLASGTVTAASSALTGWYTYSAEKETAMFKEDGKGDVKNGTFVFNQAITWIKNKITIAFQNELKNLAGARVHIVVKDNNGSAWIFGYTRGMDLVTSETGSGTAFGDRNGYTLTWNGAEPNEAYSVSNYTALVTA